MIVNGHSDIIVDITNKIIQGEEDIFYKYYYQDFKKGKVNTVILVIWIEPSYSKDIEGRLEEILESIKKEFKSSRVINHVKSYSEFTDNPDKINVILAFEGLQHLGDKFELIGKYKEDLGVFYTSLTWNEKNLFASGPNEQGGLTELGVKVLKELEKNNITIDVSHTNEETFWDIIKNSSRPIIASHSNSRNLCNNSRNLWDNQIIAIGETNGLVGLNAYGDFVSENKEKQNIDSLIDHIDHMKNLIGVDKITFGFDFCDFLPTSYLGDIDGSTSVDGLASEGDLSRIIDRMEARGYTNEEIKKISYKNYYKFFQENFN